VTYSGTALSLKIIFQKNDNLQSYRAMIKYICTTMYTNHNIDIYYFKFDLQQLVIDNFCPETYMLL
jgi:hypothetical protein